MKTNIIRLAFLLCLISPVIFSQSEKQATGFSQKFKPAAQKKQAPIVAAKLIPVSLPGRSVNYFWDNTNNQWQYIDTSLYSYNAAAAMVNETTRDGILLNRELNTYDAQNRLTESKSQYWDQSSNAWINSSRQINVYDIHDYNTESRFENWNTSANQWDIMFGWKYLITYNGSNQITNNVNQSWDNSLLAWVDDSRQTNFIYNANGDAIEFEYQIKNGVNWDKDTRIQDTYNAQNVLTEEVVQTWSVSAFVNLDRYMNVSWYNWTGFGSSVPVSYTVQYWGSPNANQWNTTDRYNATYDNFGGYVSLYETYNNNLWENDARSTEFHDSHSNYSGYRYEMWQNNGWLLQGEDKTIHTYDGSNNITQTIWQYWDSNVSALVNSEKKVYSDFQPLTGLNAISADNLEMSLFPNPSNTNATLSISDFNNVSTGNLELKLFDLFGKAVYQKIIVGAETQIDRGNLPNGVYFYSVEDNNIPLAKGKLVLE